MQIDLVTSLVLSIGAVHYLATLNHSWVLQGELETDEKSEVFQKHSAQKAWGIVMALGSSGIPQQPSNTEVRKIMHT